MATAAANKFKDEESFLCLALVKPRSKIASAWNLTKPSYCIFEYCGASGTVEIRWGDGSSQQINEVAELEELILLREFDEAVIFELFD